MVELRGEAVVGKDGQPIKFPKPEGKLICFQRGDDGQMHVRAWVREKLSDEEKQKRAQARKEKRKGETKILDGIRAQLSAQRKLARKTLQKADIDRLNALEAKLDEKMREFGRRK